MTPRIVARSPRIALGAALLVVAVTMFLVRPGTALAHHVTLWTSTTCNSYRFEADYYGGSGGRHAEVRVDGVIVATFDFPAGSGDHNNFFEKEGPLPVDTTVDIRLFDGATLIDHDVATIDYDATCATWTATSTATSAATSTPTATPSATATHTPAPTRTPIDTATPVHTATPASTETPASTSTPVPTDTPASTDTPQTTHTPVATSTSDSATNTPVPTAPATGTAAASTPTYVSTVESLLPPDRPGTTEPPSGEDVSSLPDTGAPPDSSGTAQGLVGALFAGLGLAAIASGLRNRPAA